MLKTGESIIQSPVKKLSRSRHQATNLIPLEAPQLNFSTPKFLDVNSMIKMQLFAHAFYLGEPDPTSRFNNNPKMVSNDFFLRKWTKIDKNIKYWPISTLFTSILNEMVKKEVKNWPFWSKLAKTEMTSRLSGPIFLRFRDFWVFF